MRPSDLLAKGGHRRLLESAKRVPSRGCGQFAEPLPQPDREGAEGEISMPRITGQSLVPGDAWSWVSSSYHVVHGHGSVQWWHGCGDCGFGCGLTMTGHACHFRGENWGERKKHHRLPGRETRGLSGKLPTISGGLGKPVEKISRSPPPVHRPRVSHLPSPDLACVGRFLTNTSQESRRDMDRRVGTQGPKDEILGQLGWVRGWVGPARE